MQRVDVFDSYLTNDGFDGYFANVPLPEVWQDTEVWQEIALCPCSTTPGCEFGPT